MKRPANQRYPQVGMTLSSYTPANASLDPYGLPRPQTGALPNRPAAKPKKKRITKKRIAAVLIILILIPALWLGFKFSATLAKVFHGNVFGLFTSTRLKGEDTGRVNILLAGNSSDDPLHQGADLTDSIMIISIDTKNNTAFMMSVPRDLWVDIPGYGHAKINEAYVDGKDESFSESGYFPGGMGLLQQVIEQNFNINLDYYGLIDYNAFRDMVNAVGGITVNIQSQDPRGLYDPSIDWGTHGPLVKLSNGQHTLTGRQALDLARARGDAYGSYGFPQSDFDRTMHQRQMLMALRQKVTSTGVLANPVKLSSLMDAVGNNIKTDFTIQEVHRLYDISKNIQGNSIRSVSLNNANGQNLLTSYTSPMGQSALIPAAGVDDYSSIQAFVRQLTSHNPVTREGATVAVLNATDVSGVAAKNKVKLTKQGVFVTDIGDANGNSATSEIIDASGGQDPQTLQLLKQNYGLNVTTTNPYKYGYDTDFIVIVGSDKLAASSSTKSGASM